MAPPGFDPRQVGRHERAGDPDVLHIAEQPVRVAKLERKAKDGRDRSERDVALGPVHANAEHFFPVPLAFADDALVRHGPGIRPGVFTGQAEGGKLAPVGKTRQPRLFLLVGAELMDQLARTERIGHHHRHRRDDIVARDVADHLGMGEGREAQPAEFLRDNHPEEPLLAQEIPRLGRQVAGLLVDFPPVDHVAERAAGSVDKGTFGIGQRRRFHGTQLVPVGIAGKQLRLEMDIARTHGLGLGFGQGRQNALGPFMDRLGDVIFPERHGWYLLHPQRIVGGRVPWRGVAAAEGRGRGVAGPTAPTGRPLRDESCVGFRTDARMPRAISRTPQSFPTANESGTFRQPPDFSAFSRSMPLRQNNACPVRRPAAT